MVRNGKRLADSRDRFKKNLQNFYIFFYRDFIFSISITCNISQLTIVPTTIQHDSEDPAGAIFHNDVGSLEHKNNGKK